MFSIAVGPASISQHTAPPACADGVVRGGGAAAKKRALKENRPKAPLVKGGCPGGAGGFHLPKICEVFINRNRTAQRALYFLSFRRPSLLATQMLVTASPTTFREVTSISMGRLMARIRA